MSTPPKKKGVSIQINEEDLKQIDAIARTFEVSRNKVISAIIRAFLKSRQPLKKQEDFIIKLDEYEEEVFNLDNIEFY